MIRAIAAGACLTILSSLAPMQCAHSPDPNERRDDSPGDALWGLAADFRAHNDETSARATLKYLVERYPSSRHAEEAKSELGSEKK
jgi:outer membrane protein assembly factor BamD (BamD/ComL family)